LSDIVIRAEGLGKQYIIGHQAERGGYTALRDVLVQNARGLWTKTRDLVQGKPIIAGDTLEEVWALRDVSFEIRRGEAVGIIGRNGAGKSTLLKILSRITEPSTGRVTLRGRVASLLEVGTGFHPELSGRENIYLNGAILGMTRAEIRRKFDEIVAFAEVEKYLDTPVKRYSSGMYVRLAFAVAAHLEPEILIVDEVLAVGDAAFQKKCLGKMSDVAGEGRTVLFVSHNMAAVENLCRRAILLMHGQMVQDGTTQCVVEHYLMSVAALVDGSVSLKERTDRSGDGQIRLTGFRLEDCNGRPLVVGKSGDDLVFAFNYEVAPGSNPANVDIGFSIHDGTHHQTLSVFYSSYVHQEFTTLPQAGVFRCRVPNFPLAAGRYRIGARVVAGGIEADWPRDGVGMVQIEPGDFFGTGRLGFGSGAPLLIQGEWHVQADQS
jgi:lipopolysaccharide transport system ATP-binding protein